VILNSRLFSLLVRFVVVCVSIRCFFGFLFILFHKPIQNKITTFIYFVVWFLFYAYFMVILWIEESENEEEIRKITNNKKKLNKNLTLTQFVVEIYIKYLKKK
jgi:hypothetical protein